MTADAKGFSSDQRAQLAQSLEGLNLSNDEVSKFEKAFKDPKFLELFADYAKEISDPAAKAETEAYLRQVEAEGQAEAVYGKGTQLIVPQPAFVLKTQDKDSKDKVFINICTNEKIEKPSSKKATDANGRQGESFQIPLSLGPVRQGTDKAGRPAAVWDFVVHPDAVSMAMSHAAIKNMLAETAMEQVEKAGKCKLSRQYSVPKIKYKGTEGADKPAVQAIRTNAEEAPKGPAAAAAAAAGRIRPVAPATEPPPIGSSASAAAGGSRSAFSFNKPKAVTDPLQAGYKHAGGELTPAWELVYRGQADLAAAWGDAGRNLAVNTSHPKEIVIRVQLPGQTSAAAVDLDVGPQAVSLLVPGKFKLDVSLRYKVDDAHGKAKFDKARAQLELTLPVLPPPAPEAPPMAARVAELPPADNADEAEDAEAAAAAAAAEPEEKTAEKAATEVAAAVAPAKEAELSENEKKWRALHEQNQAAQAEAAAAAAQAAAQASAAAAASGSDVCAAASTSGSAQDAAMKAAAALAGAGIAPPVPTGAPAAAPAAKPVMLKPRMSHALAEDID